MKHLTPAHKKILLIVGMSILAMPLVLGLAYGFIKYALSSVLVIRYKHQVNQTFDTFFTPELDGHLRDMGVSLKSTQPALCDNGPYSSSSPCRKYRTSANLQVNQVSTETWKQFGAKLDTDLVSQGWQPVEGEQYSSFSDLLANDRAYQVFAVYLRERHGVRCTIAADYVHGVTRGSVSVGESCSKYTDSPSQ